MQGISPVQFRIIEDCLPPGLSPSGKLATIERYRIILTKILNGQATQDECKQVEEFMTQVSVKSMAECARPGCTVVEFLPPPSSPR